MSENLETNYQSISDMDQGLRTGSWKKFYVSVSGITQGAHVPLVNKFKEMGQIEVASEEGSDYTLLFCPIASRVGTDISEALENIPDDRRVILVVMHHTFNRDYVLAESRRLVNNPNVCLIVDSLFHEGRFLECSRNDIALFEIQKFLGVTSQPALSSWWNIFKNWVMNHKMITGIVVVGVVVVVIILSSVLSTQHEALVPPNKEQPDK